MGSGIWDLNNLIKFCFKIFFTIVGNGIDLKVFGGHKCFLGEGRISAQICCNDYCRSYHNNSTLGQQVPKIFAG